MAWEHFEVRDRGRCTLRVRDTGNTLEGWYELGRISTGKQRMLEGGFIRVGVDGNEVLGRFKDPYLDNYAPALKECNRLLAELGLELLVAGNAHGYNESPMSGPSGFGYLPRGKEAVSIMKPMP